MIDLNYEYHARIKKKMDIVCMDEKIPKVYN